MSVWRRVRAAARQAFWRLPFVCRIAILYARHVVVERPRVRARIAACGIPLITREDLRQIKRGDTVYILGSGASINGIAQERWDTIRRSDSIGLNFWLFHDVVPTIYYFELVEGHETEIIQRFTSVANRVAPRYRSAFKIASEFHNGLALLDGLGADFRVNLHAHLSVPAFIETDAQLAASVKLLKGVGVLAPSGALHNLFKHAGSLSAVIGLAIKMGYHRIVLCGIDLRSPEYFYQDPSRYPGLATFQSSIKTDRHESIVPGLYRCAYPADKIVAALKRQVLDPLGIEMFVENAGSALYPTVPVASEAQWAEWGAEVSARP